MQEQSTRSKKQAAEEKRVEKVRGAQNTNMMFNYIGTDQKALVSGTIAEATPIIEAGAAASKGSKKNRKRK